MSRRKSTANGKAGPTAEVGATVTPCGEFDWSAPAQPGRRIEATAIRAIANRGAMDDLMTDTASGAKPWVASQVSQSRSCVSGDPREGKPREEETIDAKG